MRKIKGWGRWWNIIHVDNWNVIVIVIAKIMMWYIYIYRHTLCQKKKHKETKSYENIVYILLLYVYNLNFKCRKLEKKSNDFWVSFLIVMHLIMVSK